MREDKENKYLKIFKGVNNLECILPRSKIFKIIIYERLYLSNFIYWITNSS